jgi:large subunit ribosomal protein L18
MKNLPKNIRLNEKKDKTDYSDRRLRLSVYRSCKHIYCQVIDDLSGKVMASASEKDIKEGKSEKMTKSQKAGLLGQFIAVLALKKKINKVVFDRNGYKYHGRVKSLAEGARAGGLQF